MNEANDSKFVTRKWNIVRDNSKANYDEGNETTYNTEILKSNLSDCNNAYSLVRGDIIVTVSPQIQLAFKKFKKFKKLCTI